MAAPHLTVAEGEGGGGGFHYLTGGGRGGCKELTLNNSPIWHSLPTPPYPETGNILLEELHIEGGPLRWLYPVYQSMIQKVC